MYYVYFLKITSYTLFGDNNDIVEDGNVVDNRNNIQREVDVIVDDHATVDDEEERVFENQNNSDVVADVGCSGEGTKKDKQNDRQDASNTVNNDSNDEENIEFELEEEASNVQESYENSKRKRYA